MTLQEEVREFCEMRVPNGDYYIRSVPVPGFGGHTWEEVFANGNLASERKQYAVFKRLRDMYGNSDPHLRN